MIKHLFFFNNFNYNTWKQIGKSKLVKLSVDVLLIVTLKNYFLEIYPCK